MWLKLDDGMPSHPKFVGIDPRAGWLFIRGLCYAGQHLTDGFLPAHVAQSLAAELDPQQALVAGEHPLIGILVGRRIWRRLKLGYRIHGFLDHNPRAVDVRTQRAAVQKSRSVAGKIGGVRRASNAKRASNGRFAPDSHQTNRKQTPDPVPSRPVYDPSRPQNYPSGDPPLRVPPPVRSLVDAYRQLPGIRPTPRDGGVIAGLIGRHGAEAVQRVLHDEALTIAAADNPLLYLAARFRRVPSRAMVHAKSPPPTLAERKQRTLDELAQARAEGRLPA